MDVSSVANGSATHDIDADAYESLIHVFLGLFLLISIWVEGIASDTLIRAGSKVDYNTFLRHTINLVMKLVIFALE
jgi:hypothetical protein